MRWSFRNKQRGLVQTGVTGLLAALVRQLTLSVSRESPTWDEGDHIFAGYRSLTHKDFGLNPEHPPVVKMLAAAPLLSMPLKVPEVRNRFFMREAFLDGKEFLFSNDVDAMMFRARMTASILTVLLALLVFLATREFFGMGAAFIALTLIAFEPNLLAHGARVTTDAGLSCFMFATIYAFYRYVKAPSAWRLAVVGLAAVRLSAESYTSFVLGTVYPHGVWFYFPVTFVIKSTLAFLVLLVISVFAIASRKLTGAREILFLTVPPAFYLMVAMNSKINIG